MALQAAALMQPQDTVSPRPLVDKQRIISDIGAATTVTGITGVAVGQVFRNHRDVMIRTTLVGIKVANMTLSTEVWGRAVSDICRRTDEGATTDASLMAVYAVVGMDIGYDLTKRRVIAQAARTVTALAHGVEFEPAIILDMTAMGRHPVIMAILATDGSCPHDDIQN